MPIRFRCVYCEQLLGIAKRKAGSTVRCTRCGRELVVPTPELLAPTVLAPPSLSPSHGNDWIERENFADLLREPENLALITPPPPVLRHAPYSRGMVLACLIAGWLVTIGGAFAAGVWVGLWMRR